MPIDRPVTRPRRLVSALLPVPLLAAFALTGLAASAPTADGAIFRPGAGKQQTKQKRQRLAHVSGVFKVRVEGVQTNSWTEDKPAMWECDIASKGSGSERIRFKTPFRRMRIAAFGTKRPDSAIFAPLVANGTVRRHGKLDRTPVEQMPEHCLADGGDGPPPPPPTPDCGTKRFRGLKLSLAALEGKLTLDRTSTVKQPPALFDNCTWSGRVYPNLLTRKTNGKQVSTPFKPRWVFNPRFNRRTGEWSKTIMIARGTYRGRSFGTQYTTSIRWTATLKRLR